MPSIQDYYNNKYQYSLEDYNTSGPEGDAQAVSYGPGWAPELLDLRQKVLRGQATPWEQEWYQQQANAAMAVPLREVSRLEYNAGDDAPDRVSGGSPDLGRLLLTLQDKMRSGTATPQESELFKTTYTMLADQNWRASVPQESDAQPFGLGDNLFGALGTLALGATGGLAGGALAAGGGLASTLGSLGTLAGVAGTGAGVVGQATDQEWLEKLGLGLSAAGGIAGGAGGLANLWNTGITSVSDAAKLASNAGRVVGGVGQVADSDALKQAASYLSASGQAGGGIDTLLKALSGDGVKSLTDVARLAGGVGDVTQAAGRVSGNQRLQQVAQVLNLAKRFGGQGQRTPQAQTHAPLADQDWLRSNWQPWQAQPQSTLWNLPTR